MDGGQCDLLAGSEGIEPSEGEGVDVGSIEGDGEVGLYDDNGD